MEEGRSLWEQTRCSFISVKSLFYIFYLLYCEFEDVYFVVLSRTKEFDLDDFCLRAETPGVKLFLTSVIICSGLHPQFGLENGQHRRTRLVLNLDVNTDCKMYFQEILKEICRAR